MEKFIFISVFIVLSLDSLNAKSDSTELPTFGDSLSGTISLQKERRLGQKFLRSIRAQAPILDDPIIQNYLEHLVYHLAVFSELEDKNIDLVLIKNANINAFAAPGGVVGVHHGLFLHGETEHQLAAILAHELAHLSQRHFARRLNEGKKNSAISLAGFLAGIILAATASGDAAMAALTTSQGLAQNQLLKYSRDREAEADRVGIKTLAQAGMDPKAMALMFEQLQKASRYAGANQAPEFLRTHPVTKSRIADSYNQAMEYPTEKFSFRLDYQLMRTRARAITTEHTGAEIKRFQILSRSPVEELEISGKYGLALTLTKENRYAEALLKIKELRDRYPLNIAFQISEAELYESRREFEKSEKVFQNALNTSPKNYPLSVNYAETLLLAGKPGMAIKQLLPLSMTRSNDIYVWYLLAESYGLAKNIPAVHEARAEFFALKGNFEQAIKQLGYAIPLVQNNFQASARIRQRIKDILKLKNEI
ncbi:MAG: peptidase M48 [Gammaproteobacteria bacterium]|nr:peptidase M48 [Gammaproteobacteria bacterium]